MADRIREALDRTPVDNILLAWSEPSVMTRLAFYDIGPELLFIWRGESRTLEAIQYVVSTIVGHMRLQSGSVSDALGAVREADPGTVLRATDLANRFGLSAREAYEVLEEARRRNLVERRFRIRTDRVVIEIPNHWRSSLADLPDTVTTEDGEAIDVHNARNIELGFERVREMSHVD